MKPFIHLGEAEPRKRRSRLFNKFGRLGVQRRCLNFELLCLLSQDEVPLARFSAAEVFFEVWCGVRFKFSTLRIALSPL